MSKLTFSALYSASKEVLKGLKKPIVESRNQRAVASAIDSATEQRMEAEEALEKELQVITEGKVINVNRVLELRAIIKECENTVGDLTEFQTEFFA